MYSGKYLILFIKIDDNYVHIYIPSYSQYVTLFKFNFFNELQLVNDSVQIDKTLLSDTLDKYVNPFNAYELNTLTFGIFNLWRLYSLTINSEDILQKSDSYKYSYINLWYYNCISLFIVTDDKYPQKSSPYVSSSFL
jgi:hypothetical protein